jgi:hypothetical protein
MQWKLSIHSLVSLLSSLSSWHNAHVVEQMAGEVARQCGARLGGQVYQRTENMSIAEIRGYVSAIAAGCVGGEVDRAISGRRLKPAMRSRVADAAVDQLVRMVAHDVLAFEPQARARTMAA